MPSRQTSRTTRAVALQDLTTVVSEELQNHAGALANALLDKGMTGEDGTKLVKKGMQDLIDKIRKLAPVPDRSAEEQPPPFTVPFTGGDAQRALRQAPTRF